MTISQKNLRVGIFTATGSVIVYDPDIQISGQAEIVVYVIGRGILRKFNSSEIRDKVKTLSGEMRDIALAIYMAWKNGDEVLLAELQEQRIRLEEEPSYVISMQHRKYIESHGKTYQGTRIGKPRNHRTTHCWKCQKMLDNSIELECNACGWIICSKCGACGCGL